MILTIYNILIFLFKPVYFFNKTFYESFSNREKLVKLQEVELTHFKKIGKIIWFHSASMGEFEQAKPVIEIIKSSHPEIQIVCSFFSPSGYENQKNYKYADLIIYLPFDFKNKSKQFLESLNPDIAVFVRYETWANYLSLLKDKNIPCYLVCATVPTNKLLFQFPLSNYYKTIYNYFSKIFTFNHEQFIEFKKLNLNIPIIDSTDTRYDRIIENVEKTKETELIPSTFFNPDSFTLVLGSSWEPEEDILFKSISQITDKYNDFKAIIVPHEPTETHLNYLKKKFPNGIFLSLISEYTRLDEARIIIVDSIGKLLSLYQYADAAYIGGGYGVGVHSVAEPAGYAIPLACGPNHTNSPDAIKLQQLKALKIIHNHQDFIQWIEQFIQNKVFRSETGNISKSYIYGLQGTSAKISKELIESLKK